MGLPHARQIDISSEGIAGGASYRISIIDFTWKDGGSG
jgi:hypothetical protein